jgi:hypothetical protein
MSQKIWSQFNPYLLSHQNQVKSLY